MNSTNENSGIRDAYLNQMSVHPVLRKNIEEALMHFRFINVLDINAGVSIADHLFNQKAVSAIADYSAIGNAAGKDLHDTGDIGRKVNPLKNRSDSDCIAYRMTTFILSLPWFEKPEKVIQSGIFNTHPDYVLTVNPIAEPDNKDGAGIGQEKQKKDIGRFQDVLINFAGRSKSLEKEITVQGYYPLVSIKDKVWFVLKSKLKYPPHILQTVLYSKNRPDRLAYDGVKYIFQVNTICNLKCPYCYVEKTNEQMDEAVYFAYLQKVKAGERIALRGGEPFFSPNFMNGFLEPALNRGIRVLVESNGQFMGMPNYTACMDMLTHENIEVRLSLDREHFDYLEADVRQARLEWLSTFIKDAEARHIKYSFTALGSDQKQIQAFLKEIGFESYVDPAKIKPLTKYSHIEDLSIKNSYIDVKGNEHDHIVDYSRSSSFTSVIPDRSMALSSKPC